MSSSCSALGSDSNRRKEGKGSCHFRASKATGAAALPAPAPRISHTRVLRWLKEVDVGWSKNTLVENGRILPLVTSNRFPRPVQSDVSLWRGVGGGREGMVSAQENLDKREDNKGISIKSPAFIRPCFLMERQNSQSTDSKINCGACGWWWGG